MGCGMSLVKYLMFFSNFLFTLAGIAMLAVGIVMKLKVSSVSTYLDGKFSAPPVLMIAVGAVVFVVAFYGCCGAIRESSCMVTTYAVLMMVLLLVGIAVAAVAFVFKDKVGDILTTEFQEAVANYSKIEVKTEAVDTIQEALDCCGAAGPQDYANLSPIPKSCCINRAACTSLTDASQVYQTGCVEQMQSFVKGVGTLIGGLAVGVSAIILIGIIFGFCLASSIRRRERGDFS